MFIPIHSPFHMGAVLCLYSSQLDSGSIILVRLWTERMFRSLALLAVTIVCDCLLILDLQSTPGRGA